MIYYTIGRDGVPLPAVRPQATWGAARDVGRGMQEAWAAGKHVVGCADTGDRLEILKVTTALHGYVEREQSK